MSPQAIPQRRAGSKPFTVQQPPPPLRSKKIVRDIGSKAKGPATLKKKDGKSLGRKTLELITAAEAVSRTLQTLERNEGEAELKCLLDQRGARCEDQQSRQVHPVPVVDESQQTDDIPAPPPPVRQILSSIFQRDDAAGSLFRSSLRAPEQPKQTKHPASAKFQPRASSSPKKETRNDATDPIAVAPVLKNSYTETDIEPVPPNNHREEEIRKDTSVRSPSRTGAAQGTENIPPTHIVVHNSTPQQSAAEIQHHRVPQIPEHHSAAPVVVPSNTIGGLDGFRLLQYLERENQELRVRLQTEHDPQRADETARLRKQLDELTSENRGLRQENMTVTFLRRRVQQLENDNQHLLQKQKRSEEAQFRKDAAPQPCGRCVKLDAEVYNLQKESARHHTELKSLMDLNGYLREENKRLMDVENALRAEMLEAAKIGIQSELVRPKGEPSVVVLQSRNAILGRLETESNKIQTLYLNLALDRDREQLANADSDYISPDSNPKRTFDRLRRAIESLQDAVKSTPDLEVLSMCSELTHIVGLSSQALAASAQESSRVEERISQLRREGTKIKQATESTVETIREHYAQDIRKLQSDNNELEHKLEVISKELVGIKAAYSEERERRTRDNEGEKQLHKPRVSATVPPSLVLANHDTTMRFQKRIEELTVTNARLQSHQQHLEKLVARWKDESSALRKSLQQTQIAPESAEQEQIKLYQTITELTTKLGDQQLKTDQANELVNSLKAEIQECRKEVERARVATQYSESSVLGQAPTFLKDLERTLREKIQGLQQHPPASHKPQDFEKLVALLKENQNTSQQLSQLACMVDEHVVQLAALRTENADLKETIPKLRTKLKTQETAWLGKFKGLQDDLSGLKRQHDELESLLLDYEKQYQKVLALSSTSPILSELVHSQSLSSTAEQRDHPYPFSVHFSHLHDLQSSLRHQGTVLQQKVADLTSLAESRLAENRTLDARHESERQRIENLQRANENQLKRIDELQRELLITHDQKMCAESRLSKIVKGYKQLVAPIKV
ncbi:hypothetical protein DFJ77DRAFT_195012 [Powellomyces hirtus]|nr:hypothetical protein DFJ77DRAFT_195012 [Powellomyces hirtus]